MSGEIFLTDAGLETSLIFYDGIDLPCFASYPLLETEDGRSRLTAYFQPFLRLARDRRAGFILDTVTWRANAEWGARLGYDAQALDQVNRRAVAFAVELGRDTRRSPTSCRGERHHRPARRWLPAGTTL